MRGTRNKAQHLRQAAQHLHLRGATGGGLFFAATQLFQQGHGAAGGLAHIELAQARELRHFGGAGHANHGVALHATLAQIVQDRQEVVFQKQHASDHDVGLGDVLFAACNQGLITRIFRCGVQAERQTGKLAAQGVAGAVDRAGQMRIHSHYHHLDRGGVARRCGLTGRSKL